MRVARLNYHEIALALAPEGAAPMTDEGARQSALRGAKMIITDDAVEGKQRELDELEAISRHLRTVMLREHVEVRDGKVVTIERRDPETGALIDERAVLDESPGIQAAHALIATQKRRAQLQGWDAPRKQEVSGPGGGPIQTQVQFGTELEARIAKADAAAAAMKADETD